MGSVCQVKKVWFLHTGHWSRTQSVVGSPALLQPLQEQTCSVEGQHIADVLQSLKPALRENCSLPKEPSRFFTYPVTHFQYLHPSWGFFSCLQKVLESVPTPSSQAYSFISTALGEGIQPSWLPWDIQFTPGASQLLLTSPFALIHHNGHEAGRKDPSPRFRIKALSSPIHSTWKSRLLYFQSISGNLVIFLQPPTPIEILNIIASHLNHPYASPRPWIYFGPR